MLARFFSRRTIWWPTRLGWAGLCLGLGAPVLLWWLYGESFLSLTQRQPAEVLVVEGWIGVDGTAAAKAEFETGGYRYLVTSGGPTSSRWGPQRWNYATEAANLLVRLGLPAEKVIAAPAPDVVTNRTFESALVARQALEKRLIHPAGVNIMTLGVHSRRSRLVFEKALAPGVKVGAISWLPPDYSSKDPWWKSSERSGDLIKETAGYLYELLFNSGRGFITPTEPAIKP